VIRLTDYVCNEVNGKKIIIALGVEPLRQEQAAVGNPVNVNRGAQGPAVPAPAGAWL
jgi:hypothetical protein